MPDTPAREVEVWTASPAESGRCKTRILDSLLDDTERERAARFRHDSDRRAYVVAHALRRAVLARTLGVEPSEIVLSKAPDGRPVLIQPAQPTLFFSHSHTRNLVACAVTRVAPVGIDVETVRAAEVDFALLERLVVLDDEARAQPDPGRAARFYFCWTALEAFWKSEGKGLVDGNPRVAVRSVGGQHEVTLENDDTHLPRARLFPIECAGGSLMTLALRSDAGRVTNSLHADVRVQLFNGNKVLFASRAAHEILSPG